jgi:hypothetical protein
MKLNISIDDTGHLDVDVDGEKLGLLQRVSLHTSTDGKPHVTIFLPRIPPGTPQALLFRLLSFRDQARERLAPMEPWVEVVESDTIPGMTAVREDNES